MPTILVVLCIIQFWGYQGYLNLFLAKIFAKESSLKIIYSFKGILIAHLFFNLPVVLQLVGSSWQRISQKYHKAARLMGCNNLSSFWKIDLPLLLPAISSAFILVFLLCMNSFAIVWILGGGKNFIIETLIYQQTKIHLDYQNILGLVWLQIIFGVLISSIFCRYQLAPIAQEPIATISLYRYFLKNKFFGFCIIGWLFLIILSVVAPLLSLLIDSFKDADNFSLKWWIYFFNTGWKTLLPILIRSFIIAFFSAACSLLLLLLVLPIFYAYPKKKKLLEILFLTPLSISSIVLGLGWFLFYQEFLAKSNFELLLYLICIHTILFFPYWLKLFLPTLTLIPKSWFATQKLYGYNFLLFNVKVILPWVSKPFYQVFFLIMALSFGELNILIMIADYELKTMTTEIFAAISAYRFSYASLIGVIFLLFFLLQLQLVYFLTKNNNNT